MAEEELHKRIAALNLEIECLRDEQRSLKADARSKERTIKALEQKVPLKELAAQIGKAIRMRYLEEHRLRMNLKVTAIGHGYIKTGHRAAHRGRPLVDALLYLTGERNDVNVFTDLYGVSPSYLLQFGEIDEIIEVCGFHGTLKSDRQMSLKFEGIFKKLLDAVEIAGSPENAKAAFKDSSPVADKYRELQDCFDAMIAANPPRWRGFTVA